MNYTNEKNANCVSTSRQVLMEKNVLSTFSIDFTWYGQFSNKSAKIMLKVIQKKITLFWNQLIVIRAFSRQFRQKFSKIAKSLCFVLKILYPINLTRNFFTLFAPIKTKQFWRISANCNCKEMHLRESNQVSYLLFAKLKLVRERLIYHLCLCS